MNNQWPALALATTYLLLPGYLVIRAASIPEHRFLLSYALSLSLLVLSTAILLILPDSIALWLGLIHLLLLATAITTIRLWPGPKQTPQIGVAVSGCGEHFGTGICLLVVVSFGLYHATVGPYTEIPSDFWKHLARVQIEYSLVTENAVSTDGVLTYLASGSRIIYLLHAVLAHSIGVQPIDIVLAVTAVSSTVFLIGVYWFSVFIYRRFFDKTKWVFISAAVAALLTLISFGTATFSYIRYYAYFPTVFAFPLLYISVIIFSRYLEDPQSQGNQLWLLPIFFLTAGIVHHQEALLMLIILGGIAFVGYGRSFFTIENPSTIVSSRARVSASFFLTVFLVIAIYASTSRELIEWRHTPHLVDAGRYLNFLHGIPIDNPTFRLWDTVGFFGILVYTWSLLRWRQILRSNYLIAGLLVPFFTNLNPVYTTLFLHFGSPTGLWRTAYLIPLPIVAALLIGQGLQGLSRATVLWRKVVGIVPICLLAFSLLPWTLQGYYNRTSRAASLAAVHDDSGAGLWADLIRATRQIESNQPVRRILSDEITKYVLYAANRGQIWWWWPEHEYFPKNRGNYKNDWNHSDLTDTLLVWNERNGVITGSARHAGHWPDRILQIARHYPADLQSFLVAHQDNFILLWEADGIRIFQLSTLAD